MIIELQRGKGALKNWQGFDCVQFNGGTSLGPCQGLTSFSQ